MELHKIGVKIFVEDPSGIEIRELIPIFHSWIQRQVVKDHLLVDVHNYSHVWQGPGILLVAHEANFSMDQGEDRLGLLHLRKQPLDGSLTHRLKTVFRTTLEVSRLLEQDARLAGRLRFRADELQMVTNDRLLAPNTEETELEIRPFLEELVRHLGGDVEWRLARRPDPRERYCVTLKASAPLDLETLIRRLS